MTQASQAFRFFADFSAEISAFHDNRGLRISAQFRAFSPGVGAGLTCRITLFKNRIYHSDFFTSDIYISLMRENH